MASISRSTTANGSSMLSMKTRPITLITPTRLAVPRARDVAAVARHAGGVVGRPQQPRLGADVVERFFLVPDVIARGHDVDAQVEELVADLPRDAEAGGRVLAVGDDEIDRRGGSTRPASPVWTSSRPGRPTMSPMKRIRMRSRSSLRESRPLRALRPRRLARNRHICIGIWRNHNMSVYIRR